MAKQKESSSEVDDLFTQCQICLEPMQDRSPRALSCLHTYCLVCLEDLVKCKLPNRPQVNVFQLRVPTELSCPTCRKVTHLNVDGVQGLPVNFMVNQMKAEKNKTEASPDESCHNCQQVCAVVRCKDCDSNLCTKCQKKHNGIAAFKEHDLSPIGGRKAETLCLEHKKEAKYICLKCEKQVCMKCVLSEKHDQHSDEIKEFSIWASSGRRKVVSYRENITPIWLDMKERLRKANEFSESLSATLKEVKKTAAKAKASIERQEEEITNDLSTAKTQTIYLVKHLKGLCANADNFMQASIQIQSNMSHEGSNFQSIKAMLSLAECVMSNVPRLPGIGELRKAHFEPCTDWKIGTLKKEGL